MSDFKISLTAARINAGYTQKDVAKQMHARHPQVAEPVRPANAHK